MIPPKYPTTFDTVYLVFELLPDDLATMLSKDKVLAPHDVNKLMYKLVCGLNYI